MTIPAGIPTAPTWLLDTVKDRGLFLSLGDDGQPKVVGPREEITPALIEALKAHRREVVAFLAATRPPPKTPPRRLVLLDDSGQIERVLAEYRGDEPKGQDAGAGLEYQMGLLPGRKIAVEWHGDYGWARFLTSSQEWPRA